MVQFLFEGKDVHIEGYTPPEKTVRALRPLKKQTQHARPE
ncbi:Fe(2+)-trafficking protein YggX [Klebsiella pneumoniae]|uniref:Fe(2+)-trafficking protein YggX n=1 Tax=Klebsiella pneumoniae TaxID=573 RepID=A0A2X3DCV8_KLEPN|nr:Fe(2+)-trafficking protein YggX [Klebsiella pneumoniae]